METQAGVVVMSSTHRDPEYSDPSRVRGAPLRIFRFLERNRFGEIPIAPVQIGRKVL